jgi:Ring finger domain
MNKKSKRRKYKTLNKRKKNNKTKHNKKKNTSIRKRKIVKGGMEEAERDNECAICFEELNNEDQENPIISLGCNHTFHRQCVINSCGNVRVECKCPLCRRELTPVEKEELGLPLFPQMPEIQLPPREPNFDTVDEFKNYINDKLRAPTRMPLEKLENELDYFLGLDVVPLELSNGDNAMEFDLEQIGPEGFYRYRFLRIVTLEDIPRNRLNKKYFRYITYEEAGELDDFSEDELDQAGIILYNVIEL